MATQAHQNDNISYRRASLAVCLLTRFLVPILKGSSYHKYQFVYFLAYLGKNKDLPGVSCKDIKDSHGNLTSGEYWIDPTNSNDPFTVFCDMTTDGGEINHILYSVVNLKLNCNFVVFH